jgi:hypothetical protein
MLDVATLTTLAQARLEDADVLVAAQRFDGASYICGYAIEIALKARICKALSWAGYPSTRAEFQNFQTFKTHDLDVLLHLSGVESPVKTQFLADWSVVATWNPEARYEPVGKVAQADAQKMLASVRVLLGIL